MIQGIVDGISIKLNSVFGDGYTIYTESVKQGLMEPCFFIRLVNPVNRRGLGGRFFRENLFAIQFFPKSRDAPKAECYQMQDALYLALGYITVDGDLQRGLKMRGEFSDGVLNFFVNYNMHVVLKEELTPMGELEKKITTKGMI
jgi:hypothetical protein